MMAIYPESSIWVSTFSNKPAAEGAMESEGQWYTFEWRGPEKGLVGLLKNWALRPPEEPWVLLRWEDAETLHVGPFVLRLVGQDERKFYFRRAERKSTAAVPFAAPTVEALHNAAMEAAERLMVAQYAPRLVHLTPEETIALQRRAYRLEARAARLLRDRHGPDVEPSRGILHRSAAWLAFNAGYYEEAEALALEGLSNACHGCVVQELLDALEAAEDALAEGGRR
jgi:hypothetical protein